MVRWNLYYDPVEWDRFYIDVFFFHTHTEIVHSFHRDMENFQQQKKKNEFVN